MDVEDFTREMIAFFVLRSGNKIHKGIVRSKQRLEGFLCTDRLGQKSNVSSHLKNCTARLTKISHTGAHFPGLVQHKGAGCIPVSLGSSALQHRTS